MKTFFFIVLATALMVGGTVVAQEESEANSDAVTVEDLGIENPGLLPTSPFYIFKEIGRDLQRFVTFSQVGRAELELRITNEKAAEAKRVEESGADQQAVARALTNYESAQGRLKARLEALSDTSANPNVDRLLTQVAERAVLHERLFNDFQNKVGSPDQIEAVRKRIAETVEKAAGKDTPERLKERLTRVLEESKGGELKDLNAVDLLNRLENVSDETKAKILELREEAASRLQSRLESSVDEGQGDQLRERIKNAVGDNLGKTTILEELRLRASDQLAHVLSEAQGDIERTLEDRGVSFQQKAREQIAGAEEHLAALKKEVASHDSVPQALQSLMGEAERHLVAAKEAFGAGKYGEAFGQARAADAALRSAEEYLKRVSGGESETNLEERVRTQLLRLLPAPSDQRNSRAADGTACTLEYNPVCGADGETYSNECFATASGARVVSKGECRKTPEREGETNVRPLNLDQIRTQVAEPLRVRALDALLQGSASDNE